MGGQRPYPALGDALLRQGLADDAELEAIKARVADEFNEAVERARNAPLPTVRDLTTDVLV